MKNLKYILVLSLLLVPAGFVKAANSVTISEDTNISLTSPAMTLVLESGSTYSSMSVTASSVAFTLSGGGSITLTSNDRYTLGGSHDNIGTKNTVCGTSSSYVTYSVASGGDDSSITFTPGITLCDGGTTSTTGGSSGGSSGSATTNAQPATGTQAVNKTVSGTNGGSVSTADEKAGVVLPANVATGNVSMNITPVASSGYGSPTVGYTAVASQVYNFSVTSGGSALSTFSSPVTLTFKYTDSDIAGVDENTLKVYYWDTTKNQWTLIGGTVDKVKNTVTAEVSHFSIYGLFGNGGTTGEAGGGDLIKMACAKNAKISDPCRSVYYLASNGKRYVFPTEKTYYSWYKDFSGVKTITTEKMYTYDIGGNATMRPGTWMIKLTTDPKVYAVEPGGKLRWVESEEVAKKLFGVNWLKKIVDVPDGFFVNYVAKDAVANKLADKHPVGTLVKALGSADIYYVSTDGVKRKVANTSALGANNFRNEFVIETDVSYNTGADITAAEIDLIKTAGK